MNRRVGEFQINKTILLKPDFAIYAATCLKEKKPVLLKTSVSEYPRIEELSRLKYEYHLLSRLSSNRIIKPIELQKEGNSYLLIMEICKGISLDELMKAEPMTPTKFLKIGISLAETMNEIHKNNIVMGEVVPGVFFIDPTTLHAVVISLGSSFNTEGSRDSQIKLDSTQLPYISPEFTGRVNLKIDHRSDIYSLGIILYEMAAQKLPFQSSDAMELIHKHIVQLPTPPCELSGSCPKPISDIIMKCLAKIPEERYQSIHGLKNDLEICLRQLQTVGSIDPAFTPGQLDFHETFRIPDRLYGRKNELALLEKMYKEASTGRAKVLLISSNPGNGKTALVKELSKTVVCKKGFAVTGRFEQAQQHIPLSAISMAIKVFINQLLKEKDENLAFYKTKIMEALSVNGQVLVDVIPELELIIGKQVPVTKLEGEENRARLVQFMLRLIQVLSQKDYPLVMFLDDLQWADPTSLNCIKEILHDKRFSYLLLIGAYRPHEAISSLSNFIQEIQEVENVQLIELNPLTVDDILSIVTDTLFCKEDRGRALAELLHRKTNGNPFFLNQLLRTLFEEEYLTFDVDAKAWKWELEKLQKLELSENVVDLMIDKIKQFPIETQNIMSLAAAIGTKFSTHFLAKVSELSIKDTLIRLQPVIKAELIRSEQKEYHIGMEDDSEHDEHDVIFSFVNSKIHQASDLLIDANEKLQQHYRIGSQLVDEWQRNKDNDSILFELLIHLNQAHSLITNLESRKKLAKLNLEASLKSKNSAAYQLADELITCARSLLPMYSWETDYELTYSIYLESTECAFLQKKFEIIEDLSKQILDHAKTKIDKGRLYIVKMAYHTNASEYSKSLEMGLVCAELFGIKIPRHPSLPAILWNYFKVKRRLNKRKIAELEFLPEIQDPEMIFIMKLMMMIIPGAFLIDKHLLAYVTILGMDLSLKHGNCEVTGSIYSGFCIVLQTISKDYTTAFELTSLALKLAEKTHIHKSCCRVYFVMAMLINHWTQPLKKTAEYLNKCYLHGLDSGELFFLSYITVFFGFADGTYFFDIPEANKRLQEYANLAYSSKNAQAIRSHRLRTQLLLQLSNQNYRGLSLTDENFNEEAFHEELINNDQFKPVYQGFATFKAMLYYFFGHYQKGVDIIEASRGSRDAVKHFVTQRDQLFFHTMNILGIYEAASKWQQRKHMKRIKKNLKVLALWTHFCPANNIHRQDLIKAELARVLGQYDKAFHSYDEAIRHATENNFLGEAGLANELAGKLYLQLGKTSLAKVYIREAHYAYYRWGALSKTSQLKELYPQILEGKSAGELSSEESSHEMFDMAAVLRASAVLSKEIYLDKVLSEVLRVLIVEAGANRAIFLMEQDGRWVIQGEKRANQEETQVLLALPFDQHAERLCTPIVNFVLRTHEKVIINDVQADSMFSNDFYLNENHVKAVLCIPVIYQGKMSAILYLENTAAKDVFSADKIKILEMLSAQIATSIENSMLYSRLEQYNRNLENKVQERTIEIQQKNAELANTLDELKNTQNHLIEAEKLAALGQLIAGIAHEVNTPLGAVRASAMNARESIKIIMNALPKFVKDLNDDKLEIFSSLISLAIDPHQVPMTSREERQVKKTLTALFESNGIPNAHSIAEGLVEMGIYHDATELLKPLGEDNISLLNFAGNLSGVFKNNQNVLFAVEKASKIVFALKAYIHQDKSEEMKKADIVEGMESVLTLYHHQLKQNINVERSFQNIPKIPCRLHELNQVWTNLIHNALQAMNNKGNIEIKIFPEDNWVVVQIIDSGQGIPEDVKPRIFTPFFTTKGRGEGSGLGLSISKKIIEAHGGEISFDSAPGRTVFSVKLPIAEQLQPTQTTEQLISS